MNSFCFTELSYSIVSIASILIKYMNLALKHSTFVKRLFSSFFFKNKQEGFFKGAYFSQSNVAYRLEIASSIELHNEKSISLMVDKL